MNLVTSQVDRLRQKFEMRPGWGARFSRSNSLPAFNRTLKRIHIHHSQRPDCANVSNTPADSREIPASLPRSLIFPQRPRCEAPPRLARPAPSTDTIVPTMDLHNMLKELWQELEQIGEAIIVLERLALGGRRRRGRQPNWMKGASSKMTHSNGPVKKRRFSREARKRMAAAQRRRRSAERRVAKS